MIKVTIWNEYIHERELEEIKNVYPEGIHQCIAEFLGKEEDVQVRIATLAMPEHGLTEEVLADTDVLIWWSHARQDEVCDEVVKRVRDHVHMGMGLIALHSAHYSKPMKELLGTSMTLRWHHGDRERVWCAAPAHPIAAGVPAQFEIPQEECYGEYFDIPKPDDVVFIGWFASGEVFRSGVTFTRGLGKIFYFQPGHEEYPVYYQKEIQQIIRNAVHWAKPQIRRVTRLDCPEITRPLESAKSN
ncbi:ThuA domain-containing protein [Anaerosporobacter faecicola]|uniref:ThuA domain-containing protein n=1 Tax=Anaerosporobacter faecicola TaxID=2718714 RepID=UPI00143A1FAC|nr:ThuA domain-containing protein [Anaerosporobacter faecicola]